MTTNHNSTQATEQVLGSTDSKSAASGKTIVASSDAPLITFENVDKHYVMGTQKVLALNNINVHIHRGEFKALVGPSGSGKSTFLNLVTLIDHPTNGKVLYNGIDVDNFTDNEITTFRGNKVGIVFQSFNLVPVLTAAENVALALQIKAVPAKEATERAVKVLQELGLGSHLNHRPDLLSGGQKQRVAIARALVTEPEIIIADEPTSALDSKTGLDIIQLMKKINADKKTTFLFSTHDPRIINEVASVIELKDGKIVN
jgi:putative ABC transport system ATP-binding protein